jgi:RES domain-containing protein
MTAYMKPVMICCIQKSACAPVHRRDHVQEDWSHDNRSAAVVVPHEVMMPVETCSLPVKHLYKVLWEDVLRACLLNQ